MKKLKKLEEMAFILAALPNDRVSYAKSNGICPPNQMEILNKDKSLFVELVPFIKTLSQETISKMIDEGLVRLLFGRCLDADNQIKLVEYYPSLVEEYLHSLEDKLDDDKGAYLVPEAEELYSQLCDENPSLPKLRRYFKQQKGESPFAALANLLS